MTESTISTVPAVGSQTISTLSTYSGVANAVNYGTDNVTSTAIGTAKLVLYFPIVVVNGLSVANFIWVNGATAAGHTQMGVYDETFALLGNNGTTTSQTGTSAAQHVAPSSALFLRGPARYYIAITSDDATATYAMTSAALATGNAGGMGMMTETTGSFGLTNPGTPAVATFERVIHCAITGSATL